MTPYEPAVEWQTRQHQRILRQDVTAFAELCELALPHLVSFLQHQFPHQEPHTREQAAIDCLLNYQRRPEQYDPEKLPLWPFLRLAAKRDLLNLIDKQVRQERPLHSIDDPVIQQQLPPEDTLEAHFRLDEWLAQRSSYSRQEIMAILNREWDEPDKQMLLLMIEGVRETEPYARLLQITHLDAAAQRTQVKRAKDRLTKKLQRFGQRLL
ncbi:MAG: hypothetical protein KJ063_06705 [Anaerolineae bacterium]|nr:hypothetical protein [Anaerolineae bacterium]